MTIKLLSVEFARGENFKYVEYNLLFLFTSFIYFSTAFLQRETKVFCTVQRSDNSTCLPSTKTVPKHLLSGNLQVFL